MMPNPPTWIRARITTWPNGDQYVAVSIDRQPGDADRGDRGERRGQERRAFRARGRRRQREQHRPTKMASKNAAGTIRAGCLTRGRIAVPR